MVKEPVISGLYFLILRALPRHIHPDPLHFIIAAPERQAGTMAQTAHIFSHLDTDIFQKSRIIQRVNTAREDELLPDQNSITITQIIETFFFVEAASPNTQHILVCLRSRSDQPFEIGIRNPRGKGICRNPV